MCVYAKRISNTVDFTLNFSSPLKNVLPRAMCTIEFPEVSSVPFWRKNNIYSSAIAPLVFFSFSLSQHIFICFFFACLFAFASEFLMLCSFISHSFFIHSFRFFFLFYGCCCLECVCVCAFVLRFLHFLIWFFWHIVRIMLSLPLNACFCWLAFTETINVKIIITVKGTSCVCSYEKLWK